LTRKVGQTGIGFGTRAGFSRFISRSVHARLLGYYKSLYMYAAVAICFSPVNIKTHIHTDDTDSILTSVCEKLSQLS